MTCCAGKKARMMPSIVVIKPLGPAEQTPAAVAAGRSVIVEGKFQQGR